MARRSGKHQLPSQALTARPFGAVVRRLRRELEISQDELAHQAGLSTVYISYLERGLRHPSLDTVFSLAKALNIPAADLVKSVQLELESRDSQ